MYVRLRHPGDESESQSGDSPCDAPCRGSPSGKKLLVLVIRSGGRTSVVNYYMVVKGSLVRTPKGID